MLHHPFVSQNSTLLHPPYFSPPNPSYLLSLTLSYFTLHPPSSPSALLSNSSLVSTESYPQVPHTSPLTLHPLHSSSPHPSFLLNLSLSYLTFTPHSPLTAQTFSWEQWAKENSYSCPLTCLLIYVASRWRFHVYLSLEFRDREA